MKQNYRLEDDELDNISGGAMRENVADSIKDMINLFKSQNYSKRRSYTILCTALW